MPVLKREKRRPYVFIIYKLFSFRLACLFFTPLPQRFLFSANCSVCSKHKAQRETCLYILFFRKGPAAIHSHCSTLDRFRKYLMQLPSPLFFWQTHLHPFPRRERERERQKKLSISSPLPSFSLSLFLSYLFLLAFLATVSAHTSRAFFRERVGLGYQNTPFSLPPLPWLCKVTLQCGKERRGV